MGGQNGEGRGGRKRELVREGIDRVKILRYEERGDEGSPCKR